MIPHYTHQPPMRSLRRRSPDSSVGPAAICGSGRGVILAELLCTGWIIVGMPAALWLVGWCWS